MKTASVILSTLPLSETERFFYRPKAWSHHNLPGQVNRRHGKAEDLPDLTNYHNRRENEHHRAMKEQNNAITFIHLNS